MTTHFLEIIFEDRLAPGDVEILIPATYDRPGRVRLGKVRLEAVPGLDDAWRVVSHNGRGFIGLFAPVGQMTPPHNFCYLVEDVGDDLAARADDIQPQSEGANHVKSK